MRKRKSNMHQSCPICGSNDSNSIGDKKTLGSENTYVSILKCQNCEHRFTYPCPPQHELSNYYRNGSDLVLGADWVDSYLQEKSNPVNKKIIKQIKSINPISILEIGCGNGELLHSIQELNFLIHGVEPGSWLQNKNIYPELGALPKNLNFDCVVIQDVMEHVESPLKFLSEILEKTRETAKLIITIPAGDSIEARLLGVEWEMIRPLGHLHYFSNNSIRILAKNLKIDSVMIGKFRRESWIKSIIRVLLLPGLWLRHTRQKPNEVNPYNKGNYLKYISNAFSRGDQYFIIFSKN